MMRKFFLIFIVLQSFGLEGISATRALVPEGVLSPEDQEIILGSCRKVDSLFRTNRTTDEDFRQRAKREDLAVLLDYDTQQLHLVAKGPALDPSAPADIEYHDPKTHNVFQGSIIDSTSYPLGSRDVMFSDCTKIVDSEMITKAASTFPIQLHDLRAPTDPMILEALKKAHPYHGYMFQELSLVIDGALDPKDYAATTTSAGSCLCIGVLNRETHKRGIYHTLGPQGNLMHFLKLIDDVAEGNLLNVSITLASGFIRERTLVVLDVINALMQNRLGDGYTPIDLHTFPKLRLDETWTAYYQSLEDQELDVGYSTSFGVGLTIFDDHIHFLRHEDTLSLFPMVNPATDPDLFRSDGGIGGSPEEYQEALGRINDRLEAKRPEGVSDEEWAHFKKTSQLPAFTAPPSLIERITIQHPVSEFTPHAQYTRRV